MRPLSVHISNFQDIYSPLLGHSSEVRQNHCDYKALFWPSNGTSVYYMRGKRPEFSAAAIEAFRLREKLERSKYYPDDIPINHFSGHLRSCTDIEILPTVWSDQALQLKEIALKRGLSVHCCPTCTVEEVSILNTRVGGYEFLAESCGLSLLLPDTHVFFGVAQARSFIASRHSDSAWVVKGDIGVGGSGVLELQGGDDLSPEQFLSSYGLEIDKDKNDTALAPDDALCQTILVQQKIQPLPLSEMPSITADFSVYTTDQGKFAFKMHGLARQVFSKKARYLGISFSSKEADSGLIAAVRSLGSTVAESLQRKGFQGFFNVDFLHDPSKDLLRVIELNLRASAPLDQFCALQQLFGDDWYDLIDFEWSFSEYAIVPKEPIHHLTAAEVEVDKGYLPKFLPLTIPAAGSRKWPIYTFSRLLDLPN